ncbi:hypothetical protein tb265_30470 [Gemmatimonadetes bacterium T265]|nr:hypothetical protein tb265_30470 [Gemmatimonadetes bacterium T265]
MPGRPTHRTPAIRCPLNALILASCAQACSQAAAAGADRASPQDAAPRDVAIGLALDTDRGGMLALERGVTLATQTLADDPAARARRVRFTVRGARPDASTAVAATERLRDDPAVIGVVGDPESGRSESGRSGNGRSPGTRPTIDDAAHGDAHALATVAPTATNAALVGRSPWLFRLSPDDETASRAVAAYVADSLGARRAAVVYRNDASGRDWAAAFAHAFARRGGALVARDPYLAGVTEWPVYARYLASRHPEVVLFPGSADDAGQLLRALRAAGDRTPFVGGDAVAPLADSAEFAGMRYAVPFAAATAARPGAPAAARAFVARYVARYGERPNARAAMAYEAALLLGRAALAVDLDAPDRRRRVRDWLATLGGATPAVPGVAGPIAFDAGHGVVGRGVVVATVPVDRSAAVRPSAP